MRPQGWEGIPAGRSPHRTMSVCGAIEIWPDFDTIQIAMGSLWGRIDMQHTGVAESRLQNQVESGKRDSFASSGR
jgi:hypothetical protein